VTLHQINHLNTALMVISVAIAAVLPFELFLFSLRDSRPGPLPDADLLAPRPQLLHHRSLGFSLPAATHDSTSAPILLWPGQF